MPPLALVFITIALCLHVWLSRRNYEASVALIVALLPAYLLRFPVFNIPTNLLEVAIVLVFVSGLTQKRIRSIWFEKVKTFPHFPAILITLFILSCAVSTAVSDVTRVSLGILKGWFILPVLLGWLVYGHSSNSSLRAATPEHRRGGAAISSIHSYGDLIITSLLASGTATAIIGLLQIGRLDRVTSVYDVPASLALWLAPLIVLAVWQIVTTWRVVTAGDHVGFGLNPASVMSRWVPMISIPVMFAALLATQSVAGIASVIITLTLGLLIFRPLSVRSNIGCLSLLAAATLVSLVVLYGSGRLEYLTLPLRDPASHNSISVRLQLWSVSLDLIKENPVLGIGLGQFEPSYQAKLHERFGNWKLPAPRSLREVGEIGNYIQPLPEYVFRDPHNWILSFWLNTGLLGMASFIALNFLAIKYSLSTRQCNNLTIKQFNNETVNQFNNPKTVVRQSLVLVLVNILIFGLTDTTYWKNDLSALYWVVFSLIMVQKQDP